MSVLVRYSQLHENHKDLIKKYLKINPKVNNYFQKKKKKWYSGKDEQDEGNQEPVNFYEYNDKFDTIKLPYSFAKLLLNHNYNLTIPRYQSEFNFTKTLLEHQVDLYNKAMRLLIKNNTVQIGLFTGGGKTVLATKLAADLKQLSLVLVTDTGLLSQWDTAFKVFTTAKTYIVDGTFKPLDGVNVIICMTSRIHYIPEEWRILIGTLIIDESHTMCSQSRVDALLATNPYYIITCSATPERDDGMHAIIDAMAGPERIIMISTKPFNVFGYNTGCDIPIPVDFDGTPNWNKLLNAICEDQERNKLILDMVKQYYTQHKILILSDRVEHVIFLCDAIKNMEISCDYMAGKKKTYNDSNVLVGGIKKIGTGFDEANACANFNGVRLDLLILVTSIKKQSRLEQVAGRCFRAKFPQIVYLIDENPISQKHFKQGISWFVSRNGTVYMQDSPKAFYNKTHKSQNNNHNHIAGNVGKDGISGASLAQAQRIFNKK